MSTMAADLSAYYANECSEDASLILMCTSEETMELESAYYQSLAALYFQDAHSKSTLADVRAARASIAHVAPRYL